MSPRPALLAITALAMSTLLLGAGPPASERAATPGRARQCLLPQTVRNFRTEDDHAVYVRDLRGAVFLIQTNGCRGLLVSRSIGLTPSFGSSACVGDSIGLSTVGPSIRGENVSTCSARIARRLTSAEVEALPRGARP